MSRTCVEKNKSKIGAWGFSASARWPPLPLFRPRIQKNSHQEKPSGGTERHIEGGTKGRKVSPIPLKNIIQKKRKRWRVRPDLRKGKGITPSEERGFRVFIDTFQIIEKADPKALILLGGRDLRQSGKRP